MSKIRNLRQRLDEIGRIPREEAAYQAGYNACLTEITHFIHGLPLIIQLAIEEYLHSSEQHPMTSIEYYPKTKQESVEWFTKVMGKELDSESQSESVVGQGSTIHKCPNCNVEYFSYLLMAAHMFNKHAIQTTKR
jgi:hypothetical protein